jgi:hypothetical protein
MSEMKFKVGDRVKLSIEGKQTLPFRDKDIRGSVVGFSKTYDWRVYVRWDGWKPISRDCLHMKFLTKVSDKS